MIVSSVAAVYTVAIWTKILPGIFLLATMNWAIMAFTGHALNQSSIGVSRWISAFFTGLMALATITTFRIAEKEMTILRRVAYLGILLCVSVMVVSLISPLKDWEIAVGVSFTIFIAMLWIPSKRSASSLSIWEPFR